MLAEVMSSERMASAGPGLDNASLAASRNRRRRNKQAKCVG